MISYNKSKNLCGTSSVVYSISILLKILFLFTAFPNDRLSSNYRILSFPLLFNQRINIMEKER